MKAKILFIAFSMLFLSCDNDNPYEQFEGQWEGRYIGEDTGSWNATINSEGEFSGTAVSDSLPNFPFNLTGQVSENGEFTALSNVAIGTIEFDGQLNNSEASGTWINVEANLQGTWSGERN